MGLLAWIVLGGLSGWIASIIMKRNDQMGCITNIVVGVLGALIGGWVASLLGFGTVTSFSLYGVVVAVLGAVALLAVVNWFQSR